VNRNGSHRARTRAFCFRRSFAKRWASTCHVDLDGHLLARKGQVDPPWAEGVAEHPARNSGVAQDANQQAFGGRIGPVRSGDEQATRGRRASPTHVAAEGPVRGGEADVALQGAVQERRPIRKGDRCLEDGERHCGEPEVPPTDEIDVVQVAPSDHQAGLRPGLATVRHRELDLRRRPFEEGVPVGGRRSGHRCFTSF